MMVRGNRFLAGVLSLAMVAQTVLTGNITPVYAGQKDLNDRNVAASQIESKSEEQPFFDETLVSEAEDGEDYVTVTLDANGGYFKNDGTEVTEKKMIGKPGDARYLGEYGQVISKDDHKVFRGWGESPDGDVVYDTYSTFTIEGNKTLYALWEDAHRVVFHASEDGGVPYNAIYSGGYTESRVVEIDAQGVAAGNDYATERVYLVNSAKPLIFMYGSNKDKSMYLVKWVTKDGDTEFIPQDQTYTITQDLELYPVYEKGYRVKFIAKNGNFDNPYNPSWKGDGVRVVTDSDDVWDESQQKHIATYVDYIVSMGGVIYTPTSDAVSPDDPEKCLIGWKAGEDGSVAYMPGESIKPTGDLTFYAAYGSGYTITYDANGGMVNDKEKEEKIYAPNEEIDLGDEYSAVYKDDTKKFVGWASSPDSQEIIDDFVVTKDQTVYAVYKDVIVVTLKIPNGKISYQGGEATDEVKIQCTEDGKLETTCSSDGWAITRWAGDSGYGDSIGIFPDTEGMVPFGFHIGSVTGEWTNEVKTNTSKTIFLNWVPAVKLTLDYNGGSVDKNSTNYKCYYKKLEQYAQPTGISYDDLVITSDNIWRIILTPPDDDYEFMGWTTEKDNIETLICREDEDTNEEYRYLLGKTTLYAYWGKPSKVIYDANGGYFDDDPDEETYVQIMGKDDRLEDYTYDMPDIGIDDDNLAFDGWSLTKDGKKKVNMRSKLKDGASVTLYAVWVPGKTITFNGNGGGHDWVVTWEYKAPVGKTASPDRFYGDPEREGYVFVGWNIVRTADAGKPEAEFLNDEPLSNHDILFNYIVTEDITAYAVWAEMVTVTLDAGDKGNFVEYDYDEDDNEIVTKTKTRKMSVTKGGYVEDLYSTPVSDDGLYGVSGWSLTPGGEAVDLSKVVINADTTVYAVWSPYAKLKLNYNLQTLTGEAKEWAANYYGNSAVLNIIKGTSWYDTSYGYEWNYMNPQPYYYPGETDGIQMYDFAGWTTAADGENLIDRTKTKITQDMELYAVWKPVITVRFHANGGCFNGNSSFVEETGKYWKESPISDPVSYQGNRFALAARDDYALAGWSTVSGNDNTPVDADTYRMGMSKDLYAVWTKDYYTLTVDMGEYLRQTSTWIPYDKDDTDETETISGNDSPLYLDEEDEDDSDGYMESSYEIAPAELQIRTHRLCKNSKIGSLLKNQYMVYNTYFMGKDGNEDEPLYLKGFSTQKTGAPLVDIDNFILTKDTKLYAIYEDVSSYAQRDEIRENKTLSEIPATAAETEEKAQLLVTSAIGENAVKKTLSDIMTLSDSQVLVNAVNEVKDQTVIDSFKGLLVAYMDTARNNNTTVEAVQLFDINATGSGKVMIYVGKAYNGRIVIVGHYKNGVWENQQCEVDWNGYICPSFRSFSPISISILSATQTIDGLADTWKEPQKNTQSQGTNDKGSNATNPAPVSNKPLATDISKLTITLSKDSFAYTGKEQKPVVTVKDSAGKVLKEGTDYDAVYSTGSKKVGEYKVTITCKGEYTGTKAVSYRIIPKNATGLKAKASGTSIKVSWKKQTKGTSGYEVQYADNKKYKKAKTQTVKKNKTTSVVLKKKIKKGKTYYVRIRSFKTVGGKKIYSAWSGNKKVKIKK